MNGAVEAVVSLIYWVRSYVYWIVNDDDRPLSRSAAARRIRRRRDARTAKLHSLVNNWVDAISDLRILRGDSYSHAQMIRGAFGGEAEVGDENIGHL